VCPLAVSALSVLVNLSGLQSSRREVITRASTASPPSQSVKSYLAISQEIKALVAGPGMSQRLEDFLRFYRYHPHRR